MHSRPVSGHDRFLDFVYGYVAQIADIDPTPMETVISKRYETQIESSRNNQKRYETIGVKYAKFCEKLLKHAKFQGTPPYPPTHPPNLAPNILAPAKNTDFWAPAALRCTVFWIGLILKDHWPFLLQVFFV